MRAAPRAAAAVVAGVAGLLAVATPSEAFCNIPDMLKAMRGGGSGTDGAGAAKTIYDFTVKDWQGNPVPLSAFQDKAKVALIVNVASK